MNPSSIRPPDSDLPRPGDVIAGKYRVDGIIGSGGMGVVLGATDTSLGRPVAIKFLAPHKARRDGAVPRFLREARAAAAIEGEHVVRVFEIGTTQAGAPYIVMEKLRGSDLSHELATRGPMPVHLAVDHLLQACEALGEAHGRGIVHRDLKPQNLFLTTRPDGSPCIKILDFGISKAADDGAPNLTSTDQVMGTPLYMSPEQVRSLKNVDHRSDIWALGSILFELLTGKPIYEAPSASALCAMIAMDPPVPLRARLASAPAELEAVILRCLHKDPAGRYQDVAQLAEALAPFASERGRVSATRVSRVVRSNSSAGAPAMTPGAYGVPHLGGVAAHGPTVDAGGRSSYAPVPRAAPAPWAPSGPPPPAVSPSSPNVGAAGGPMPLGPGPGTQSTWHHSQSTGSLTGTGERRGTSPVLVAMLGVLTGVVLLALLVGAAFAYLKLGGRDAAATAGADASGGATASGAVVPEAGGIRLISPDPASTASTPTTVTSTKTSTPGPDTTTTPKKAADAGVLVSAAKDAGAPATPPAVTPPPGRPAAQEALESRKRLAETRCRHFEFQIERNQQPANNEARSIKLSVCTFSPQMATCERTLCMRACTILDDKMCLMQLKNLNRMSPAEL